MFEKLILKHDSFFLFMFNCPRLFSSSSECLSHILSPFHKHTSVYKCIIVSLFLCVLPPQNLCHYRQALETRSYVTTSTILSFFFRFLFFYLLSFSWNYFFLFFKKKKNIIHSLILFDFIHRRLSILSYTFFLLPSFLISYFCSSSFARFRQLATNIIKEE